MFTKNILNCINLQVPNEIFSSKSIFSDMQHRMTCIYINFQQNRLSKPVKSVHTNLFAKNHKLHKFATANSNFEKN